MLYTILTNFSRCLDKTLKKCPKCGRKRAASCTGAAILFRAGFYQTDYRSDSYKAAAKAEQDTAKPAAAGNTSSTSVATGSTARENSTNGATSAGKTPKSKPRVSDD